MCIFGRINFIIKKRTFGKKNAVFRDKTGNILFYSCFFGKAFFSKHFGNRKMVFSAVILASQRTPEQHDK